MYDSLFYGGRRRYLIDVGPDDKIPRKEAILLPPDLLKSPRQRRYTSRYSSSNSYTRKETNLYHHTDIC